MLQTIRIVTGKKKLVLAFFINSSISVRESNKKYTKIAELRK